jgi:hypothetical protein
MTLAYKYIDLFKILSVEVPKDLLPGNFVAPDRQANKATSS